MERPKNASKNTHKQEVANIAAKIFDKKIKKFSEPKYVDSQVIGNLTLGGSVIDLLPLSVGDTDNSRDGNQVRIQKIEHRFSVAIDPASGSNPVRFILFRWNMDSDVEAPVLANGNIIETPNDPASMISFQSLKSKKIQVLYDYFGILSDVAPGVLSDEKSLNIEWNVRYTDGAFTTGTGHPFLLSMSNSGSDHPQIHSYSRVTYTDA